jgi:AsmA protein
MFSRPIFTEMWVSGYRPAASEYADARARPHPAACDRIVRQPLRLVIEPVRALKLLGIAVGGLVALIAIALTAVWLFVDPNDYKPRVSAAVRTATGRELELPGKIKLSVFPWIALELGSASLGNPPGFGTEPFATVRHAAVRVRLLPLLRKRLEMGHVQIDGLDLRLRKNADGKGNWQDFGGQKSTPARSAPTSPALPDLAGITIEDSRISYQDIVADHVHLDVGQLKAGAPVPVSLTLDLTAGPAARPIPLRSKLNVTIDPARERYGLAAVALDGTLNPNAGAKPVAWKFASPRLDLDLAGQTLGIPSFTAELAMAHLSGSLQATRVVDAPAASLVLRLDPVDLRDLMGALGVPALETRDPGVLKKFALGCELGYGHDALRATKLDAVLDDTRLRGDLAITNLDAKAVVFDLAVDRIDLDRYRSPEEPAPKPAAAKPAELPTDSLKALQMKGDLTIGSARFAGINLSGVHLTAVAQNGVTHIAPLKATLYGGEYSGDITLDARERAAVLKLDQSMRGVDVAQLLSDLAGTKRISGRGNVTTALTAHGSGSDAVLRSLSGHVSADLADGAVEGLDLGFEINRAVALFQKQAPPAGSGSGRTRFEAFKATADLVNGVATTKDLNIASQNLRVTGQGTSNLVSGAIDYRVKATILKAVPTGASTAAATLADIPLNISGTMAKPHVQPDLEGIAKSRLQQEFDKHKGDLQQKLQDKLKQLLR